MSKAALRQLDYEHTLAQLDALGEIRFKLLALLPLATGGTLAWSKPEESPATGVALGTLGLLATLGILFYDQRNTELYEGHIRRAKLLELKLRFPAAWPEESVGGPLMNRPARGRRFLGVTMWHDRGLGVVYSAVLAAWSYLLITSIAAPGGWTLGRLLLPPATAGALAALVVFTTALGQLALIDRSKPPRLAAMDAEIRQAHEARLAARRARAAARRRAAPDGPHSS